MTYDRMNLTVTIDGVDRTSYVVPGSMETRSVLTRQIDTADFVMEKAGAVEPVEWDEVVITDGATKVFGGYVLTKKQVGGPDIGVDFDVACGDYASRLDHVIVKEEYEDQTDAYIIGDLVSKYLSGEGFDGVTDVSEVKTHTKVRLNRMTFREALDALAEYAKADWYVDYDKGIHFFTVEDGVSPFNLSDAPDMATTYPFDDLVRDTDGSGVANRVEVVGGNYLSDDQTIYLDGTGQDVRVSMPFRMRGPSAGGGIQVSRNDGTEGSPSWTTMTVKTGYIDTLGGASEVLHYYQEKVLEQQNNWPNLPNAVRVVGRFEVPLRTRTRDDASYTFYGDRWFDEVIVNTDITDKSTAKLAAKGLLAKRAMGRVAVVCSTFEPGLRAGQTLHLTSAMHGIDDDFLIQEVVARIGVYGRARFKVSLGVSDPDLVDIILMLARRAKGKPLWRDDEVLDELLEVSEVMGLSELSPVVTPTGAPYTWGIGGSNDFGWGFGKWI